MGVREGNMTGARVLEPSEATRLIGDSEYRNI